MILHYATNLRGMIHLLIDLKPNNAQYPACDEPLSRNLQLAFKNTPAHNNFWPSWIKCLVKDFFSFSILLCIFPNQSHWTAIMVLSPIGLNQVFGILRCRSVISLPGTCGAKYFPNKGAKVRPDKEVPFKILTG